jgi:Putative zinc-finger
MTCERIRPLLSSYHDDALSPEERARVRAHLSTCADCSAVLTAYETMYATLQRAVAPVPPDLRRKVYARIAEMEARPNARPPFVLALLALLRSAGATAGLLAVLAALLAALVRLGAPQHADAPIAARQARGTSAAGTTLQPGHASPSPTPTIPAGDGLVYVHLSSVPAVAANAGASRGELEWHAFARGARPRPLVTPGPSPEQVVTSLSASRDGDAITYTVAGRGSDSDIFRLTMGTPQPTKVLASDSGLLLNGAAHLLGQVSSGPTPHGQTSRLGVGQVFPLSDVRLSFSLVGSRAVRIDITSSNGLQTVAQLRSSINDYAISPDMQRIAWVQQGGRQAGRLEIAHLGAKPFTQPIGLGRHPVWAPDGHSILFLQGTALALWSARDGSVRRLVTPDPAGHEFISAFAWAPGGRFFTYVLSSPDPHGTSTVWLGDAQTGTTRKSFARRWIGAIAWVHGRAFQPTATAPAATPTSATSPPSVEAVAGVTPTLYDNTATPADAVLSFYNAINRHDFRRAYSYLSFTDGRSLRQFMAGYADTGYDQIVRLISAPYQNVANGHALTCIGIQLLAHNTNGQTVRYGGWYLVKRATGQDPHFAGWRIQMPGTHVKRGSTARVPPQARCVPPPPTPTASAG